MKQKKLTVTIGIPTLNAEGNIISLLQAILRQHAVDYLLKQILVYSDGSTDLTVAKARSVRDPRIRVIEGKTTRGFAAGLQHLLSEATGDVIILINDDVTLADEEAITRIVDMFADTAVGLVCGKIVPLPSETFIERAVRSSFDAYARIKEQVNNGNNLYTCDGKILAISRAFAKKIDLHHESVGNVDLYLYFFCRSAGFRYRYVKEPTIYFRLPRTARDVFNQTQRATISRRIGFSRWEKEYRAEVAAVRWYLWVSLVWETLKNPIGAAYVFAVNHFGTYVFDTLDDRFETWTLAYSTKNL